MPIECGSPLVSNKICTVVHPVRLVDDGDDRPSSVALGLEVGNNLHHDLRAELHPESIAKEFGSSPPWIGVNGVIAPELWGGADQERVVMYPVVVTRGLECPEELIGDRPRCACQEKTADFSATTVSLRSPLKVNIEGHRVS